MKFRELPAFEKNDFKVGDNVRVYGYITGFNEYLVLKAKVNAIENDKIYVICEDWSGPCTNPVHYKQCRKLERIEQREIWINEYHVKDFFRELNLYDTAGFYVQCFTTPGNLTVKFREVLEEDE